MKKVLVPLSIFLRSDPILYLKPVNRIFHYITTGKLALLVACSISHLLNAYDNKRGPEHTHIKFIDKLKNLIGIREPADCVINRKICDVIKKV